MSSFRYLYFINNIADKELVAKCRRSLIANTVLFLVFFLAFVIRTLLADGYAVNPETKEMILKVVDGSMTLLLLTKDGIYAARDKKGRSAALMQNAQQAGQACSTLASRSDGSSAVSSR